jgi:hypothetical protein
MMRARNPLRRVAVPHRDGSCGTASPREITPSPENVYKNYDTRLLYRMPVDFLIGGIAKHTGIEKGLSLEFSSACRQNMPPNEKMETVT